MPMLSNPATKYPAAAPLGLRDRRPDEKLRVLDYHEHAIGSGAEARAVAYVELRVDERAACFGVGIDTPIVNAAITALFSGLRRAGLAQISQSTQEKNHV